MIHPAVQKVPDSLHSTFHLRTMKHNRNQRQIKQKSQYPRLPSLIARRGNVLFVASIASLAAGPQACGYVTAKHALIGLMRSVARDYGPQGVRANAICPGWVTTPMADEEMHPLMQAEGLSLTEAYQRVCRDVPLRRPASPEEIAQACQFLCSPQAAIISGATLVADGGASIVDVPTLAFA